MFDALRNWLAVRAAMKDERRRRSAQTQLNAVVVEDTLRHAAEMLQAGQRDHAARTLDAVLARFPEEAAELPWTPHVLIGLGRLDAAERLTLRGIRRHPDSRDFARLHCEIADHRNDIPERLRRWGAFQRRYPAYGLGFRMAAAAMLTAGQEAAAEKLLAEGVRVVEDDPGLASDYARRAEARADWPEARRRWALVLDRFDAPLAASRAAAALVEQGLFDRAAAELTAARRRFPHEAQLVDDLAMLAERGGDLDTALLHWSDLRRDLPHAGRGYTEAARLLRDRGEAAAAEALITEGARRAPADMQLQFAYATLAEAQGDWAAAAQRWQVNRARFPADVTPARGEPVALRRCGRLDEAEQALRAAIAQFPAAADLHVQLAEIAEARGDRAQAVPRWQAASVADPASPAMHLALARAMAANGDRDAADAALAAAIARLPDAPDLHAAYATLAAEDGRAEAATARWAAARRRFGPVPALLRAEADGLRDLGRLDAARALLTDALRAAPDHFELLHDLGKLAAQAGDWPVAETCWRSIAARHPQIAWVPGEFAQALAAQGRMAEADAVLAAARDAHPQDFGLAAAWARLPSTARDWSEAARRWALLRERFPTESHPLWQQGEALREAGQLAAARDLFLLGAERFPADGSFPHELARMSQAGGDWPAAERWWRILVERAPAVWWAHVGLADALRAQDRVAEAEDLLLAAQHALPEAAGLGLHHAWLALLRQDWATAEQRFRDLAARFPPLPDVALGLAVAARELGRPAEAAEILRQGMAQHPDHAGFPEQLAHLAQRRESLAQTPAAATPDEDLP